MKKTIQDREDRALHVFPCPHCKAGIGEDCRRPSGRAYKPGHDARLMALQKWREERRHA